MTNSEASSALVLLLANAGAGLALFDAQRLLVVANAQAAALAGAAAWSAGQDLAQLLPGLLDGATGDAPPAVLRYRTAEARWLEVRLTPLAEGGFTLNLQEASARVAQEEQGLRREAALAQAMQHAPVGILLFDREHRLVGHNDQSEVWALSDTWKLAAGDPLDRVLATVMAKLFGDAETPARAEAIRVGLAMDRGQRQHRRLVAEGRALEVYSDPTADGGFMLTVCDVSELAAAEAAARQAAARMDGLLKALPHRVTLWDAEERLVATNQVMPEIFVLPERQEVWRYDDLIAAQVIAELSEGPEADRQIAHFRGLDRSVPIEVEWTHVNGRVFLSRSTPMEDGGFVITNTDISELVKARQAAERNAASLDGLLQALPHRIMLWGADRRLLLANAAMPECFVSVDGRTGAFYDDMIAEQILAEHGPGPRAEAVIAGLRAQDRSVRFEAEWTHQNGRAFLTRSMPMRDGGFVITSTEITDLVQAREAAQRNATILEGLLQALPHRVSLWNADHRLLAANHTLEEVFPDGRGGMQYEDLARWQIGKVFGDGPEAQALITQECEADRKVPYEFEWTHPNGRSFLARSTPLRDGGFVVSNTEITETMRQRRAAEDSAALLDRVLQALPHRVAVWGPDQRLLASNLAFPDSFSMIEGDGPVYYDDLLVAQARGMHGNSAAAEAMIARHRGLDRTQRDNFEWRHQNGRSFLGRTTPTPDGGFIVTNTEITELVQVREAARQNAAMLNSLVQALPNRVTLWGADRRLLAHNDRFADAFPLLAGDGPIYHDQLIEVQARAQCNTEAEAQTLIDYYRQTDRTQRSEREWTHANGMAFLSISAPTADGGFVVSNTDITARVTAEREMQRRGDILEALLEALPHRVSLWNTDGELLVNNAVYGEIFATNETERPIRFASRMRHQIEAIFGPGAAADAMLAKLLSMDFQHGFKLEWQHPNGAVYMNQCCPVASGGFVISNTDITELAQARQAVQENADMLSNLLRALPQRVSLWGPDRRLVASNDAFHNELGALRQDDGPAVLFDDDMRAMAKRMFGDGADAATMLADVLSTDRSKPSSREWTLPGGRVVSSLSVPMPDGGFVISSSDISDLVQSRQAAQRNAETLSALLKGLPHRVSMWDRENRLVAFNTMFAEFFRQSVPIIGMTAQEASQQTQQVIDPSDPSAGQNIKNLSGFVGATVWRHTDGAYFATQVVPSDDGGFILTHTDVTEQETTRRRLMAAEAEQRALISAIPGAVLRMGRTADGAWEIRYASAQITGLTGYEPDEVIQPGWVKTTMTEADYITLDAEGQRAWDGEDVSLETELTRKDGRRVWLQGHMRRDQHPNGEQEVIATWFDVTGLRRATQEVAATRKLAALGALATGMAHELNQPLAGIMLAAENGLRNLTKAPERVEQKLETIIQQARRASDLIDQMRVFRRRGQGPAPAVLLADAVGPALKKCQERLSHAKVRVVVEIAPDLPPLPAERVLLEAALVNVITNACEAYERLGGEGERALEISGQRQDDDVLITVRDAAGGIAPENLPYVFDPFFTTKPVGGGPGLGLAVAFGILADLRGNIRAESADGVTEIVMTLPVAG